MRICFLSPLVPSVAYGHRPYSFLSHLSDQGHDITLHCVDDPGPVPDATERLRERGIDVRPFALARPKRWWNCLKGLAGREPLRVLHCRSAALERRVSEDLVSGDYDLFHIDRFRLLPYGRALRSVFQKPIVVDYPDALSLYYERAVENPRGLLKSLVDRREHSVIAAYEAEVLSWGFQNVVCSEVDRDRLREARPDAAVEVIPNMVDTEAFVPRSKPEENDATSAACVFTGTLYYLPNIDALLWLKEKILPLLGSDDTRVEVIGFGATSALDSVRDDPAFRFQGFVENMADHLFQEDIFLCPLRVGAGLRFKLLEAFAAGMAVISTTLGYEGIPCEADMHLLVADTEEEFAQAIRFLLENPEEKARLGKNAREFVTDRYSVEATGRSLESLYEKLVD